MTVLTAIAAVLFVIGCFAFTADAATYAAEELSVHAALYLTGSLLFLIGSTLWTADELRANDAAHGKGIPTDGKVADVEAPPRPRNEANPNSSNNTVP